MKKGEGSEGGKGRQGEGEGGERGEERAAGGCSVLCSVGCDIVAAYRTGQTTRHRAGKGEGRAAPCGLAGDGGKGGCWGRLAALVASVFLFVLA